MAMKKAKEIQDELLGSAHKVWLAGLGALSMAEEEGGKLFKNLIQRGEDVEQRGKVRVDQAMDAVNGVKTVAESYWDTFENMVDDKVTAVIHRLGVPTKDEIEDLTKKVEGLTESIDKMRSKEAKAKSKPKAKPKTDE